MKDNQGNTLTTKEFMRRWKQGIVGITPMQQARITVQGTCITILGIVLGIIATFFDLGALWWVLIILLGALVVTSMQLIGQWQRYKILKGFEVYGEEMREKEAMNNGME